MRKGLTDNIEAIIERVASLNCIKDYTLCGGTALAIQLGHRKSEDLDFMMWRISKNEKPEVDWPAIKEELQEKVGEVEKTDILGFDQVLFIVHNVKISFYVSNNYTPVNERIPYMGNIHIADVSSILAMKLEVMLRRMKQRDYYDVYSIVKAGYSLDEGIDQAIKYSGHKLKTKNIVMMLLSNHFDTDSNFCQLEPVEDVSNEEIRGFLLTKLK